MEKLTSPTEAYKLLQEMKPKAPAREPHVKIQEILKLYEKTKDVLEMAILEMDLDDKDILYGMTKLELQGKLDEVLSEKLQLDDYVNVFAPCSGDYDLAKKLSSDNYNNVSSHTQGQSKWLNSDDNIKELQTYDPAMEILILPAKTLSLDVNQTLEEYINTTRGDSWTSVSALNCMQTRMSRWIKPYVEMFTRALSIGVGNKMLLYSNNKGYIVGLRNMTTQSKPCVDTSFIEELAKYYEYICKGDASVKHIELYTDFSSKAPIISMRVHIDLRKEIHVYKHESGKRSKIYNLSIK